MSGLLYPSDIYEILREMWNDPSHKSYKISNFPKKEIFKKLIDTVYHASFLTEEQRRIWFRIVYVSKDELITEAQIPQREIRVVEFSKARDFTIGELVKLAPAADPIQVLIGVYHAKSSKKLKIWGLIENGTTFWELTRHESMFGISPPDALTLSSKKAGQIIFSRAGYIFLRLDQGKIEKPSGTIFDKGPIANFLQTGRKNLRNESKKRMEKKKVPFPNGWNAFQYVTFIERILNGIRERFHGGTLIIIPDKINPSDTRLRDRIVIKYPCDFDALNPLIDQIEKFYYYESLLKKFRKQEIISSEDAKECINTNKERQTTERRLTETANFISSLSAVDGAVVMTENLHILGFGAEIIAISPSLNKVKVITDYKKNTGEFRNIELFGTRHRSAFRFCSSFENAITAIVSQHGGIKLAKRVGSNVLFWPNISSPTLGI